VNRDYLLADKDVVELHRWSGGFRRRVSGAEVKSRSRAPEASATLFTVGLSGMVCWSSGFSRTIF